MLCNWFTYAYLSCARWQKETSLESSSADYVICSANDRTFHSQNIRFQVSCTRSGNSPTTLYASARRVSDRPRASYVYQLSSGINLTVIARISLDIINEREFVNVVWCVPDISILYRFRVSRLPKSRILFISPDNSAYMQTAYESAHRLHVPPQYFWMSIINGSNEVKGCAPSMHAYIRSVSPLRRKIAES